MYDSNHKEGMNYKYTCNECGAIRMLDHPFYSTNCPDCNKMYNVEVDNG